MSRYSPKKYAQALYEATKGLSDKEQSKILERFIDLLDVYNDRSLLSRIIEAYERERRKKEGIDKVEVTSAQKLPTKIRDKITARFKGKGEFVELVEPAVLGGVRLVINEEYLIDATLAGRVDRLYKSLLANTD